MYLPASLFYGPIEDFRSLLGLVAIEGYRTGFLLSRSKGHVKKPRLLLAVYQRMRRLGVVRIY